MDGWTSPVVALSRSEAACGPPSIIVLFSAFLRSSTDDQKHFHLHLRNLSHTHQWLPQKCKRRWASSEHRLPCTDPFTRPSAALLCDRKHCLRPSFRAMRHPLLPRPPSRKHHSSHGTSSSSSAVLAASSTWAPLPSVAPPVSPWPCPPLPSLRLRTLAPK